MLGEHLVLVTLYHSLQLVMSNTIKIGDTKIIFSVVIPPHTMLCKGGFSKQDLVKNHLRFGLKLKTLECIDASFIDKHPY